MAGAVVVDGEDVPAAGDQPGDLAATRRRGGSDPQRIGAVVSGVRQGGRRGRDGAVRVNSRPGHVDVAVADGPLLVGRLPVSGFPMV
jgi:hypothetical protein